MNDVVSLYIRGVGFDSIILLDVLVDNLLGIEQDSFSDLVVALGALLVTTVFGTPMHVLSGYLVGLEVTRQTHFMKVSWNSRGIKASLARDREMKR